MQSQFSDNLGLVTIFQRQFLIYYIKTIYLVILSNLVTVFVETKSVTKSRLPCMLILDTFENNVLKAVTISVFSVATTLKACVYIALVITLL